MLFLVVEFSTSSFSLLISSCNFSVFASRAVVAVMVDFVLIDGLVLGFGLCDGLFQSFTPIQAFVVVLACGPKAFGSFQMVTLRG